MKSRHEEGNQHTGERQEATLQVKERAFADITRNAPDQGERPDVSVDMNSPRRDEDQGHMPESTTGLSFTVHERRSAKQREVGLCNGKVSQN